MIINGQFLLIAAPIKNMVDCKEREHGVSHGLSEAGYDIRVAETIRFKGMRYCNYPGAEIYHEVNGEKKQGSFALASSMEEFQMPDDMVATVHDKSTWARRGLFMQNTVIEPGWRGFLTLEITYQGQDNLLVPAGAGIAQILFHELKLPRPYDGKYQDQQAGPVKAILD